MTQGAFHSAKHSEISGPKLNGTVKIPGKVFENLGIRWARSIRPKFPENIGVRAGGAAGGAAAPPPPSLENIRAKRQNFGQ